MKFDTIAHEIGFVERDTVELLGQGLVLLLAAMVVWGLWQVSRPRAVFVVRLRHGEAKVIAGTVTPAFLQQIREVVAAHGVTKATVSGIAHDRRIALRFSRSFPAPACQQLRNWWAISGWPAGKNRQVARR